MQNFLGVDEPCSAGHEMIGSDTGQKIVFKPFHRFTYRARAFIPGTGKKDQKTEPVSVPIA